MFVWVPDHLVEKHLAAAPNGKGFAIEQNHLPQVFVGNLLVIELLQVVGINCEGVSLSIETVDLISSFVIEAFVWKVFLIAIFNFECYGVVMVRPDSRLIELWLANDPFFRYIPNKVEVRVSK